MLYLWLKVAHVFFVISWFAGLFYLPRIFVNLAMVPAQSEVERERLLGMAKRLKRFMIVLMVGSWATGLAITLTLGGPGTWWVQGWLHAKLLLVLFLTAYDGYCSVLLRGFRNGTNTRSHVWYRVFNELPTLLLLGVVILVIIKPF
ncbi:MAG: hypothetical protein CGU28_13385 [Candidatus Dactylopiibacterium carminicum]|uniref:Protoporphyrinogen IX oxidase n=1 Tax=Candidatus Dactylopiibacterium carminicum TaxID=857335 RepID=A0A272EP14_9RHOO|nr:CopD family protein [Candidatus Dactylopiibacterium carminicum]KAF7598213.1 CopD family protein [Candidatus Dactylopiibacterium carminicum]PAS91865.1 MAG: hypothetical protein CGU29_14080 [Candidatus Dactylopiibacterium carminicum]PAS94840.1 MAG: hypothetical protein CGU28_13385 [Candidatus Dactylopiibacterium carminicum]PAS97008.1 MAG: hypothetical protein BSR46_14495 [Candidatus Dactylopiibacterium carminicum]